MISTYFVGEFNDDDQTVVVTYINEDEENAGITTYFRNVRIPRLKNGEVDEEYFAEVLENQLAGVIVKEKRGIIHFQ